MTQIIIVLTHPDMDKACQKVREKLIGLYLPATVKLETVRISTSKPQNVKYEYIFNHESE